MYNTFNKMKKNIILLSFMMISSYAFSQVGVNTTAPAATLDIKAKNATASAVDGLLIPRVDRLRAQSMTGVPVSTLIYVTSVLTGSSTGTNIDAPGYYYFDESSTWTKLKTPAGNSSTDSNIYNNDGTLQSNRTVAQAARTLAFTGTAANAFSVDGNTLSVDAANNRIGIGTITPSAPLEINSGTTAGAIKIVDGTQGNNKVLVSDANGTGTWQSIPGSLWVGILSGGTSQSPEQVNFTGGQILGQGGATDSFSSITVPSAGLYEIITNARVTATDTSSISLVTFSIQRNGATILAPHYAFPGGTNFQFLSFTNYFSLNAGDVITLFQDNHFGASNPVFSADGVVFSVKLLQ